MDMAADAPASWACQLTTRTWIITDGAGKVDHVHGPGVVGAFPKMFPGAAFSYESCCPFVTPTGKMEGSFQMAVHSTGNEFDADVPRVDFVMPPMLKTAPLDPE